MRYKSKLTQAHAEYNFASLINADQVIKTKRALISAYQFAINEVYELLEETKRHEFLSKLESLLDEYSPKYPGDQFKEILRKSVYQIGLSVRSDNMCNNAGIITVGELAMKTDRELLRYRNFGKKSLREVKSKLAQFGLITGMQFDISLVQNKGPESKPDSKN